jgi:hypothetical protein
VDLFGREDFDKLSQNGFLEGPEVKLGRARKSGTAVP